MQRYLIILMTLNLLVGCSAQIDDLVLYTNEIKQNTQVSIEEYPEFTKQEPANYSAADLRSPFERIQVLQVEDGEITSNANCIQPETNRVKTPLEAYGIDALRMSGIFNANGQRWALIKANDGSLHKIRKGQYIGLFNGKVTEITNNEIVIEEMLPDGAGCWKVKKASMTMASLTGESDNV